MQTILKKDAGWDRASVSRSNGKIKKRKAAGMRTYTQSPIPSVLCPFETCPLI